MIAHKLQLKIFVTAEAAAAIPLEAYIPVLHRWVRDHVLAELVIDVANYAHVPEGPGVVLIGHATDYFMDGGEDRLGLLCNRKRSPPAAGERLADLARRALYAAHLLESEPALAGTLRFSTREWLFRINDRLAAPNDDSTFDAIKPELDAFFRHLLAGPIALARTGTPKDLFSVRIASPTDTPLSTLLDRAGGPPTRSA